MPASSQSSTVSFGGGALGELTGWSLSAGQAITADITGADSEIFGTGDSTRVLRELDCVGIEPGRLQVRLFGCPPFTVAEIGDKGTLSVSFTGGSLSAQAILDSFEVEAAVGELLRGTASFILTGT
jgi:hypothetical protein